MKFLEEDLEDLIYNASQTEEGRELLYERGLPVDSPMQRQVDLDPYGRLDLLDIECDVVAKTIYVVVYELKKGSINRGDIEQLCRYMTGIGHYIKENPPFSLCDIDISGRLIGAYIPKKSDFYFLLNHLPNNLSVYTYDLLDKDEIIFEEMGKRWVMNNSFFPEATKGIYEGIMI